MHGSARLTYHCVIYVSYKICTDDERKALQYLANETLSYFPEALQVLLSGGVLQVIYDGIIYRLEIDKDKFSAYERIPMVYTKATEKDFRSGFPEAECVLHLYARPWGAIEQP